VLITDSQTLADFCSAISDAPYIAVDTEFMRERTYYAQLCLVQVAYGDHAAAIDPLVEDLDLGPLRTLLLDEGIVKVLHSATQDLEIFLQKTGAIPSPVFDTQIAASVCDLGDQPGYAKLVSTLLGISIDKASQATDWSRRPLSERQIEYAIGDVTHLCKVYELLLAQLKKTGRGPWVDDEMKGLLEPSRYTVDPDEAFRRVKVRRPKPRTLVVLRELARWREQMAIERNSPRGWIVKDEAMVEIAEHLPKGVEELARVRKLSAGTAKGPDGKAMLDAVQRGLAIPKKDWPSVPPKQPKTNHDTLIVLLQALLTVRCEEHGVAPRLIANRAELSQVAAGVRTDVRCLTGWRNKVFGEDAIGLIDGRLALTGHQGGVEIFDLAPD
jgi:ribonuclease D